MVSTALPAPPSWAAITGFTRLQWSAGEAAQAGDIWTRLETPPIEGAHFALQVFIPAAGPSVPEVPGARAWLLFQPALSRFNGWDEHPEELALSCIVEVEVTALLEAHERAPWIQVQVLRTVRFGEIACQLPERHAGDVPARFCDFFRHHGRVTVADGYTFFDVDFEGDIGEWMVVETREGQHRLIVHGV